MNTSKDHSYQLSILNELIKLPTETEWVEFKHNNKDPDMIGKRISSLANAAVCMGKKTSYLLWGIEDETHEKVGTSFSPRNEKVGQQELESWLLQSLSPKIHFSFHYLEENGLQYILLEIPISHKEPVKFKGAPYIRIGSVTRSLKDHPEHERALWRAFDNTPFETLAALEDVTSEQVLRLIDYPKFFDLLDLDLPPNSNRIIEKLESESVISKNLTARWDISNLGAILFAKNLNDFKKLGRKILRVVFYNGSLRLSDSVEIDMPEGYAVGFESLLLRLNEKLPKNEVLEQAIRKEEKMFPSLAIRELVANALIHQDFSPTGTGPLVEVFDNRIEITNPGSPLVNIDRFLDSPPRSRNEALASLMRRMGICEERGSGIDKVVFQTELYQLPAPTFQHEEGFTRITLFSHKEFEQMSMQERTHACYLHASLCYLTHNYMTNESLRKRFGLPEEKSYTVSKIISATRKKNLIAPAEENQSNKYARYIPHWMA